MENSISGVEINKKFPIHGWIGLLLMTIFWSINWAMHGLRTHWGFFPMWLGYCLLVDAMVLYRTGTSLLTRSWSKYIGLFLVSAPVWWLFEALNAQLHNWKYLGIDIFTDLEFGLWATLNFTTVIPAVFGTAELLRSYDWVKRIGKGPRINSDRLTTTLFFLAGWGMLALMLVWPHYFFPFMWISVFFILEPLNVWLGNHSLTHWTRTGDWRPIIALWAGVLVTAFFWEMWNYFSYPKWVYSIPWGQFAHIFEMPALGYGGYLPFALELYAMYHFAAGLLGNKKGGYVQL
ncbi:MAG: hypothetical protein EHM70_16680 [Chloroflexota bacterium]|nr:MAG: hypothetical protein EHM70_16680 [Chloroflexota bacterium]